ncbi:hypothetical protein BDA99DRAFT_556020 [Phascolomyces articulosus]|uniref:Uncharacterized protein n=1 Tax=Phascolomyces articulosus TaxID=60185 RepID=A0AAD5KKC2_9FUNG|nr:hypothetical protein BDA99DRAFT_556020 [Phascolomyces articulosus]
MQIKYIALLALPFFALFASAAPADSQEQPTTNAQQGTAPANGETKTAGNDLTKEQQDALDKLDKGVKEAAKCFQESNYEDVSCYEKITKDFKSSTSPK